MAVEIVGSFLGAAIPLVQWCVAPIRRQFSYLCCFTSNIESLKDEAQNLHGETEKLQMKVLADKNNARVIFDQVEAWLEKSNDMKERVDRILVETPNVESGCCLKLGERFSLSRKAKKTSKAMKEHLEKGKFSDISSPPPIAAIAPVLLGREIREFDSRRKLEEGIMKILEVKNVSKIGICGMGGVGKTTLAEKIMNRALKEGLFDEVVKVVVSQPVEKLNIQLQIAEPLGLKLTKETLISRAKELHERLTKEKKRRLIMMDDVWERLNLEELGIPSEDGFKWCTILFTSRNKDVFRAMNVDKICEMEILNDEEAWILFRDNAGTCVDDSKLNRIAQHVMRECKGLPVALATVGVALKDEDGLSIWEDALRQLRKNNPSDISNVITQVYNPLKLSYDRLDSKNAKLTFLLCCLFAEDDDISLEHLTYFAMGLHLLEGIWELEEVRGRMCTLIEKLKTRYLLLDGSDEYHVRMHDVVRDVSIFIASQERRVKCSDCTWISSFVDGRARFAGFPNLKLLFVDNKVDKEVQIDDSFIGGSGELNVLFIKYGVLKSLPHSPELLKSLTVLVLYHCESLESISVVGQFESLEILVLCGCGSLEELPLQVKGIKQLRVLEISRCFSLTRVAAGVLSCLVGLEELKIVESFKNWEAEVEGKERENAGLRELESLTNLRCLEIQVADSTLAAQPLRLSDKLVKYDVQFGKDVNFEVAPPKRSYQKIVSLNIPLENTIDLWSNVFLTSAEYLAACGKSADINLDLAKAQNMRCLSLDSFKRVNHITSSVACFPLLEVLNLEGLDHLKEIWDGPIPPNSFNKLKVLTLAWLPALKQLGESPYHDNNVKLLFGNLSSLCISWCHGLCSVFSSAPVEDWLLQLKTISIAFCNNMEQVVLVRNEQGGQQCPTMIFRKLEFLSLCGLPKLTSICQGIESIEFPVLAEMEIDHCPKMKCFISSDDDNNPSSESEHYEDDDSLHLFCQPKKVSFGSLKKLSVWEIESKNAWCDKVPNDFFRGLEHLRIESYSMIRRLFSSSIALNLVNLQKLHIEDCGEMVRVVEDTDKDVCTTKHCCGFPNLQEIRMYDLPKSESFCEWRYVLELPSLKKLDIRDCPRMRSFSAGSLITPAMQTIIINHKELESVIDLNHAVAVQYHFQKAKAEAEKQNEGGRENEIEEERDS